MWEIVLQLKMNSFLGAAHHNLCNTKDSGITSVQRTAIFFINNIFKPMLRCAAPIIFYKKFS
jgi:hypothetical protein